MWLWGPILSRLVHETSQSRGGKEHLSKLQMQNWFSEEHVYWGWEFRAFMGLSEPHTTWEPPVAVLELSVPPGRDGGAPQECPFLTSLQEIPALLRLRL